MNDAAKRITVQKNAKPLTFRGTSMIVSGGRSGRILSVEGRSCRRRLPLDPKMNFRTVDLVVYVIIISISPLHIEISLTEHIHSNFVQKMRYSYRTYYLFKLRRIHNFSKEAGQPTLELYSWLIRGSTLTPKQISRH